MSEAILKALMQLFALISDIHDDTVITGREKEVVRLFLKRHLNDDLLIKYMALFEENLRLFSSEKIEKGSLRDRKRISLNAMRILSICQKLNEELHQSQKVYVFVKLIDYISSGEEITGTELEFLDTVGQAFNIPGTEIFNIRGFIMNEPSVICESGRVLVISNGAGSQVEGSRFFKDTNVNGSVSFLHVQSVNLYVMRYYGSEALYLNGQNITPGESYIFDHGSSLRGAGTRAIFYTEIVRMMTPSTDQPGIWLDAIDVTFRFRNSENGTHNLNLHGESGELTGIIGGSGVGKSTALSILNGSLRPDSGRIFINGHDLYTDEGRERLKGVIGYVPQDDLLIEELTVYQNLYFNARMCLDNLSEQDLDEAVNKTLTDLDLYEVKDLKVGSPLNKVISGGQRKRINIALELIREPTILFVDEPTSGLSSVDSEMVMRLLKDLTYKGKLVIVNIHQPSSDIFKMFDRLMVIDRGGYQVYYGNPSEAIVYFRLQTNHASPYEDQCSYCGNVDAEQLLQTIESKVMDEYGKPTRLRKVTPEEWARRFSESTHPKNDMQYPVKPLPENKFSIPGLTGQAVVFFRRDVLSRISDRQYMLISLLGPPLLAFILAWFIKTPPDNYSFSRNGNIPPYLFMCVITSLFFGLMGSSEEIIGDRKILKREEFLNLSWFSYLSSKILILSIISAIQAIFFVLVGNIVLEIRGMVAPYWLVLFTTSFFGNILGLNLSSAFRSVITVYIIIPFIIIPQLLFSGVMVRFDKLHLGNVERMEYVPVIGDLMIGRWSFEAIASEQFSNNRYEKLFFSQDMDISNNEWKALYLVDILKKDLWFYNRYRDSSAYSDEASYSYRRLGKYLHLLSAEAGIVISLPADPVQFGPDTQTYIRHGLDSLRHIFTARMIRARNLKDSAGIVEGEGRLMELKDKYDNQELRYLLLDEKNMEKSIVAGDRIIRKFQPGLQKAESPAGRAHFYAPVKKLGTKYYRTFGFNICFIWLVSIALFMVLLMKLPGKITGISGRFRLPGKLLKAGQE